MEQAQRLNSDRVWGEISLVLTDDAGMARLNAEYFGRPHSTDVISFRYDALPGEGVDCSGEVIVNVERACEEGAQRHSVDRELALYIAHGCQHLAGAEDRTTGGRRRMRRRERAWLEEAAGMQLLHNLVIE